MRPRLQVLEPSLVERIVDEALGQLERQRHADRGPARARASLAKLGLPADPDTNRVRLPRAVVEKALASTHRRRSTLHDRDGNPYATLEGDNVHFVPASSALRMLDRNTGAGARSPGRPTSSST